MLEGFELQIQFVDKSILPISLVNLVVCVFRGISLFHLRCQIYEHNFS